MTTYKIVYSNNQEIVDFDSVQKLYDSVTTWNENLLVSKKFNNDCAAIVNEETNQVVAYMTCRSVLKTYEIEAGDPFYIDSVKIDTYADSELKHLK